VYALTHLIDLCLDALKYAGRRPMPLFQPGNTRDVLRSILRRRVPALLQGCQLRKATADRRLERAAPLLGG